MRIRGGTILSGAAAALAATSAFAGANKFIAAGWEFNDAGPDALLARADAMDETPMDGCVLYLSAIGRDGRKIGRHDVVDGPALDYADLAPQVPKYRKLLAHKSFRHSFLAAYEAPKNRVAWNDDATWARIAHNVRTVAKFAKACGFVGLRVDSEDYHGQRQYFRRDDDGMSYEELFAVARRRGRQVFSGVFEEFPDVRILGYYVLSEGDAYMGRVEGANLRDIMQRRGRDLWTPFIDGVYDAITPSAVMIDGTEQGYSYRAPRMDFFRASNQIHKNLGGLLSPENRAKYKAQTQNAFGLFLNSYCFVTNYHPLGYYMEPVGGSRARHLGINLSQAVEAADEYVWFWGARSNWTSEKGKPTWNDLILGLHDTLLAVKAPAEMGRVLRERMEAGQLVNANTNSACISHSSSVVPKPYWTWQESEKKGFRKGRLGCDLSYGRGDKCSLVAEGVEKGCFVCNVDDRRPGEIVGVSFRSKGRHIAAKIQWRKGDKWNFTIPRVLIPISGETDAEGWTRTDWCVIMPEEGADGFGLTLDVAQDAGEKTWFDDIIVIAKENRK